MNDGLYGAEIRSGLRRLVEMNKAAYPEVFEK